MLEQLRIYEIAEIFEPVDEHKTAEQHTENRHRGHFRQGRILKMFEDNKDSCREDHNIEQQREKVNAFFQNTAFAIHQRKMPLREQRLDNQGELSAKRDDNKGQQKEGGTN